MQTNRAAYTLQCWKTLYLAWLPSHSFLGSAVLPHLHLRRGGRVRQRSSLEQAGCCKRVQLGVAPCAGRGARGKSASEHRAAKGAEQAVPNALRRRARRTIAEALGRRGGCEKGGRELSHAVEAQATVPQQERTHHRSRTSSWRASLRARTRESEVSKHAAVRAEAAAAADDSAAQHAAQRRVTQSVGAPSQLPSLSLVLPQAHVPARTTTEARPEA